MKYYIMGSLDMGDWTNKEILALARQIRKDDISCGLCREWVCSHYNGTNPDIMEFYKAPNEPIGFLKEKDDDGIYIVVFSTEF